MPITCGPTVVGSSKAPANNHLGGLLFTEAMLLCRSCNESAAPCLLFVVKVTAVFALCSLAKLSSLHDN